MALFDQRYHPYPYMLKLGTLFIKLHSFSVLNSSLLYHQSQFTDLFDWNGLTFSHDDFLLFSLKLWPFNAIMTFPLGKLDKLGLGYPLHTFVDKCMTAASWLGLKRNDPKHPKIREDTYKEMNKAFVIASMWQTKELLNFTAYNRSS